jgi:hypothetical protein
MSELINQRIAEINELSAKVHAMAALDQQRVAQIHDLAARLETMTALDQQRVAQIHDLAARLETMTALDRQRVEDYNALYSVVEKLTRGKAGDSLPLVVVNSLPKTGSQTINQSLTNAPQKMIVQHHHAISDRGIQDLYDDALEQMQEQIHVGSPEQADRIWYLLELLRQSLRTRQDIVMESARLDARRPYFISGVREPVALFLSLVYQLAVVPNSKEKAVAERGSVPELIGLMRDFYAEPSKPNARYIPKPDRWLDREIVDFLGVDPFTLGFDKARGYQVYDGRRGKVLLVRAEDLSRVFDQALKDLLGPLADGVERRDVNTAAEKEYSESYKATLAAFKVPGSLLDEIYSSRYSRTFYTPEECAAFRARWVSN